MKETINNNYADPNFKWLIPLFISLIIFSNHYARDTVATLQIQIEETIPISTSQYNSLNSLFFTPNIIMPLFIGYFSKKFGMGNVFAWSVLVGGMGHFIFSFGATNSNISLMYIGRLIAGSAYEVIDMLPIIFMNPLFREHWGLVCGMVNSFLRLGIYLSLSFISIILILLNNMY
jgi:MFS family permease